jgi:hypothetical protein
MNTATQLLERCKHALIYNDASDLELLKDIDDLIAKQQVETLKPLGTIYRWTSLKDGKLIYQYSDQGYPELFKKNVVTLPTEPEQQVEQEPVDELKTLRLLYNQSQEEVLRLSLICEEKARGPMSDYEIDTIYTDTTGFLMSEGHGSDIALLDFTRAIEAHHGIK